MSTGSCSPTCSALDWWAALGPPTPARGGTGRLWVVEKSPRPAEQLQATGACLSTRPAVGPAPGTASVGDTTADPGRHCPRPAQPLPTASPPPAAGNPLSPCIFKTSFPGGTHHPLHSPQSRVPTETLIPARNPRANNGPAPVPPVGLSLDRCRAAGRGPTAELLLCHPGPAPPQHRRAFWGSNLTGSPGWGGSLRGQSGRWGLRWVGPCVPLCPEGAAHLGTKTEGEGAGSFPE